MNYVDNINKKNNLENIDKFNFKFLELKLENYFKRLRLFRILTRQNKKKIKSKKLKNLCNLHICQNNLNFYFTNNFIKDSLKLVYLRYTLKNQNKKSIAEYI